MLRDACSRSPKVFVAYGVSDCCCLRTFERWISSPAVVWFGHRTRGTPRDTVPNRHGGNVVLRNVCSSPCAVAICRCARMCGAPKTGSPPWRRWPTGGRTSRSARDTSRTPSTRGLRRCPIPAHAAGVHDFFDQVKANVIQSDLL